MPSARVPRSPTRRAGLRREPQGRGVARRDAMLEAARELFLAHGFEGTSISAVVRRSGGSLATLYASFGSKEGLFEAIIADVANQIVEPLASPDFESLALEPALRAFGERFLSLVLKPEPLAWHRIAVVEGAKFPELRAALLRVGPGHVHVRLAAYLAEQAALGRLRVADPRRAALHFFALVKSENHLAALCGEPIPLAPTDIADQVRAAVEVFLTGYAESGEPYPRATSSHPSNPKPPRSRSSR